MGMGQNDHKTLKATFSPLVAALLAPRGTAAIPQGDVIRAPTRPRINGARMVGELPKRASCVRAQECFNSVAVHRRSCIDIGCSCTTDTFE